MQSYTNAFNSPLKAKFLKTLCYLTTEWMSQYAAWQIQEALQDFSLMGMIHGAQNQAFGENILSSATTTEGQHPPSLPLPPSCASGCCSACWLTDTGSQGSPVPSLQPQGCSPPRHISAAAAAHFLSHAGRKECALHQFFRKMTLSCIRWGFFIIYVTRREYCHSDTFYCIKSLQLPWQDCSPGRGIYLQWATCLLRNLVETCQPSSASIQQCSGI